MKQQWLLLSFIRPSLPLGLLTALSLGVQAQGQPASPQNGSDRSQLASASKAAAASARPWGQLETREFALELSDELLPEVNSLLEKPKWDFTGFSMAQITNLLRSCHFSDDDVDRSFEGAELQLAVPAGLAGYSANLRMDEMEQVAISLYPPTDLVLNLGADDRKRIYETLAASEQNARLRTPFQIPAGEFEQWLLEVGLPAEKLARLKRLAYPDDGMMCLADLEPLMHILTASEMKSLLKAVYRNPTFVMKLQLSSRTDVDALSRYWGRGGRARSIKPFLEGLSKVPGNSSVNIAFLMPAFARTHLYTFPDPAKEPASPRNCGLWTALNFFNDKPDDRYLESGHARQVLQTRFEKGDYAPAYGDLVALSSPDGELVHVAVYIAEDVIFTRSGLGDLQPWVLMRLPEMVKRFATQGQLQTVIYRRKEV